MRVDSHLHLWRYTPEEYGWIDDSMQPLRRDFLPEQLADPCAQSGVNAVIAVQARQTLEETAWLLQLASQSTLLRGVVGWAPVAAPEFPAVLEQLQASPLLKGLRHVVQAEAPGFLDEPAFNRGISALRPANLVYDILIFARQLPEAIRFVDCHPDQQFVLDHIAKPDIRSGGFAFWDRAIRDLARRPNVVCKLSGMVTEADWQTWSSATLQPYFETVLEAFTPARLMFGSDWPVLTVASTYPRWIETVESWIAPLTPDERAAIFGETAARIYRLSNEN